MPAFDLVLLDVDGTLLDTAPGILESYTHTFETLELAVPSRSALLGFIGPGIFTTFTQSVGLPPDRAREAVAIYRSHYAEHGARHPVLFPGAIAMLDAIVAAGLPLITATSKPEATARRMLEQAGVADRFTDIAGASADEGRASKTAVIAWALELAGAAGLDPRAPVMVGDRIHDVQGAAEHGIPAIVAGWGYGEPDEAREAIAVAESPLDAAAVITGSHP